MQNKNNIAGNREHRNTGTPEQPPQTPRARGARAGLFQSQVKKSKERAIAT